LSTQEKRKIINNGQSLRHVIIAFTAIYLNMLLNISVSVTNSILYKICFPVLASWTL